MERELETQEGTAGSEGEEQDNNGASEESTTGDAVIETSNGNSKGDSDKTVPESDLLAVKSALTTTQAELKTSQDVVASERAMRVAAEANGAKVEGLTKELTSMKEQLASAQEQVNMAAAARVEALRQDLVGRGATEEQVKDLDEAQLKLASVFQPVATTPKTTSLGFDVAGSGQEDVSGLTARDKLKAGLADARR
jgi:hypothetical protein